LDEVKNKDDDDDDTSDGELHEGAEDSGGHGIGIFPADPPDVELGSAVDQAVNVRQADDQQQSDRHTLRLREHVRHQTQSHRSALEMQCIETRRNCDQIFDACLSVCRCLSRMYCG